MRALPKANGADLKSAEGFRAGGIKPSGQRSVRRRLRDGSLTSRQPSLVLKSLRCKNALPSRPTPPTKHGIGDSVGGIATEMAGRIAVALDCHQCSAGLFKGLKS